MWRPHTGRSLAAQLAPHSGLKTGSPAPNPSPRRGRCFCALVTGEAPCGWSHQGPEAELSVESYSRAQRSSGPAVFVSQGHEPLGKGKDPWENSGADGSLLALGSGAEGPGWRPVLGGTGGPSSERV